MTTALEQRPPGIFEGLERKEAGKVRFLMKNQEGAKFEFKHEGMRFAYTTFNGSFNREI